MDPKQCLTIICVIDINLMRLSIESNERRARGQVPILRAFDSLSSWRTTSKGTSAHVMGTCPPILLSSSAWPNYVAFMPMYTQVYLSIFCQSLRVTLARTHSSRVRYLCKAEHGHETIIYWSWRARQEDRGTGACNMGTCLLAHLFIAISALSWI